MGKFDALALTTERLRLRPLSPSDAPAMLAIRSDEIVMRYHSSLPWTSIDSANATIASDMAHMQTGEYLRFGLERITDSELIGSCGLFSLDTQCKRAEIGYELLRSAWGHGYMDEALRALLNYGFTELALNRVEADVHPDNVTSIKSLQRLGFQKEGYLRERWIVGDVVSDSAIFGLLKREWVIKA
jgi:RimJ/RimL family protein N-acetyltransferase